MTTFESTAKYILQSKIDIQFFEVNGNVINASTLLKNICYLTQVTEPISINCSALSLDIFINLINHYETITDEHDVEFEENYFKNLAESRLIDLIKEVAILDSDFFLDSIADFILRQIEKMKWNAIKEYMGLEDDFTATERAEIEKYSVEYLLSINTEFTELKFPFPNTNFSLLKTKFTSPMNSLLARVIERSIGLTAYNLSIINKTLKNENDRFPIRLTYFHGPAYSRLLAGNKAFIPKQEYFQIMKKRKVMALRFMLQFEFPTSNNPTISVQEQIDILSTPLDYCIPVNNEAVEIRFQGDDDLSKLIYYFDITSCPFLFIQIKISCIILEFKDFYEHIIKNGLLKRIEISSDVFNFFQYGSLKLIKKPNSVKFHECIVFHWVNPTPRFNDFIKNYMEPQGNVITTKMIRGIPKNLFKKEAKDKFIYDIPTIQNYLSKILPKKI